MSGGPNFAQEVIGRFRLGGDPKGNVLGRVGNRIVNFASLGDIRDGNSEPKALSMDPSPVMILPKLSPNPEKLSAKADCINFVNSLLKS